MGSASRYYLWPYVASACIPGFWSAMILGGLYQCPRAVTPLVLGSTALRRPHQEDRQGFLYSSRRRGGEGMQSSSHVTCLVYNVSMVHMVERVHMEHRVHMVKRVQKLKRLTWYTWCTWCIGWSWCKRWKVTSGSGANTKPAPWWPSVARPACNVTYWIPDPRWKIKKDHPLIWPPQTTRTEFTPSLP